MKTWLLVIIAIASAICTLLAFSPVGLGIGAIGAPMFLILIALHAKNTRSAVFWTFVFQIPLWLWLHAWIEQVAFIGWFGLALYMSLWAPLFVYLLRLVQNQKRISLVLSAPILWVGLECLRGIVIFDGYPWYLAGTGIVDLPMADVATIGSVWLASFLVVSIASLLANIMRVRWWTIAIVGVVCADSAMREYGFYYLIERTRSYIDVAVIQTNVSQSNKVAWSWERQQIDVSKAIDLTYKVALEEDKPDLIIWPETMLPGSGFEVNATNFEPWHEEFLPLWYWAETIRRTSVNLDIPILVGAQTWLDIKIIEESESLRIKTGSQFNSAVLVRPDGSAQRYDKAFLTPFGEKIPYLDWFPTAQDWVRETFGAAMLFDLSEGEDSSVFALPATTMSGDASTLDLTFATPICFEDTVPSVVRKMVWEDGKRKADVLINLSNDGWFGDDVGAHWQHVREAQMRCIENRTPMIRAANTGISCLINARGQVMEKLPVLESGILRVKVYKGVQKPLSRYFGDTVAWASLLGSILLILVSRKKWSSSNDEIST
ncbi:MAG: apolipoprotein N-acyltransferase [Phycisphaerae bacterium]|jgi:apolipoprotein N-acyltransferase|nr:apolipoprotein N-acyltransferase [Phycisphaerae bacterium]